LGEITLEQLRTYPRENFTELYKQCYDAFVRKNSFDLGTELLEDFLHESLEVFYAKLKLDPTFHVDNVQAWIYTVFKYKCLNHFNRGKKYEPLGEIEGDKLEDKSTIQTAKVIQVLKQLGKSCQDLLKLAFYKGLNTDEIAKRMDYTYNYAKNKKSRCIKKMRELMKNN
jgi:RNA polymerase sigma factor (sigma-70 family)